MTKIWQNFTDYIIENYSSCTNIIEVGVGKIFEPSDILKEKLDAKVQLIDINPAKDTIIQDDITNPNLEIYKNCDLIYSIRPPEELQCPIVKLTKKIGAELILKLLNTEEININLQKDLKIVNHKKLSFYIMKKE